MITLFPTAAQAGTQAGTDCVAGAPGAGDPYYPTAGNGGYDVRHYDLNLRYRPATDRLDGRASIRAKTKRSLCSFNLDLVGLDVLTVRVNGKPAASSRSGQELTVTPREPLAKRAQFDVAVRYVGRPVEILDPQFSIPIGFTPTSDGVIVAGEPAGAAAWFPVNDHPSDEASYSFNVTVPAGYEVVANGKPHGRAKSLGGSTEWRWEAREPMPSYLVTVDVGYWDVTRWRTGAGVPVYDAVDSAITGPVREQIDSSLARQGEILKTLSAAFGPYPFDTIGAIVDPERPLGFALETQTRPVYWSFFWLDDLGNPTSADYVVVHELAHQWFGDDVALERWQDIWLNEGFATYAEWLWLEHEGVAGVRKAFDATYAAYPAEDPLWSVVVGDPGPEHQLDDAVYYRGAMTLQALREEIGDEAFWKLIRRWAKRKGGGHGSTGQFIATAERVSGRRLDSLFETWLFTPHKPPPLVAPRPGREQTIEGGDQNALTWLAGMQDRLRIGRY